MELSELDIEYALRTSMKGQIVVDFVLESAGLPEETKYAQPTKPWQVFVRISLRIHNPLIWSQYLENYASRYIVLLPQQVQVRVLPAPYDAR